MRKIEQEVEGYLGYCREIRGMSATTMAMKQNVLGRFIKILPEAEKAARLTNADLDYWMRQEMERGVSSQTVNTYNSVVVAWLRYMREAGEELKINFNLIRKRKVGGASRRKFYTREEILRVCEVAERQSGDAGGGVGGNVSVGASGDASGGASIHVSLEISLMIKIMFETGMRIAEITRLSTLETDGRRINFLGKGGKKREVYLSLETAERLGRFVGDRVGYVWGGGSLSGEPPTTATVRARLRAAFEAAGFDGFYPHALRHSFATELQRKGASVAEIKEMMGHSSIATTERYLHGFDGRMEELFSKYQGIK